MVVTLAQMSRTMTLAAGAKERRVRSSVYPGCVSVPRFRTAMAMGCDVTEAPGGREGARGFTYSDPVGGALQEGIPEGT